MYVSEEQTSIGVIVLVNYVHNRRLVQGFLDLQDAIYL